MSASITTKIVLATIIKSKAERYARIKRLKKLGVKGILKEYSIRTCYGNKITIKARAYSIKDIDEAISKITSTNMTSQEAKSNLIKLRKKMEEALV